MRSHTYAGHRPTPLLYELIDRDLWRLKGMEIIEPYIGYSTRYKSLTVSLFDKDRIMAICIRKAQDKEGNPIKWKTYGFKRFIPYRIFDPNDPTIFVGYGIGEFLLFELLELNYMVIQSDSIAHSLQANPYTPKIKDRYIFCLLDNDSSCRATLEPIKEHFKECEVYGMEFENMLDKELPKGYDFRDFCNDVARQPEPTSISHGPMPSRMRSWNTWQTKSKSSWEGNNGRKTERCII
ncbi:MAG: hypothetical protein GXO16_04470 [Epsilonproteobacteria bacterium]|nr:hypothetical protein [Campylobacterota bacterium]